MPRMVSCTVYCTVLYCTVCGWSPARGFTVSRLSTDLVVGAGQGVVVVEGAVIVPPAEVVGHNVPGPGPGLAQPRHLHNC